MRWRGYEVFETVHHALALDGAVLESLRLLLCSDCVLHPIQVLLYPLDAL